MKKQGNAGFASLCSHHYFHPLFLPTGTVAFRRTWSLCLISLSIGLLLVSLESGAGAEELSVPYEVKFEGISDKSLLAQIKSYSNLVSFKKWPPATIGILERRSQKDIPRLLRALKAQGFYGAKIEAQVNEKKKPVLVTFQIDPGPVYLLQSVKIEVEGDESKVKLPSLENLKVKLGEPARAQQIADTRELLESKVQELGFPFAKAAEPKIVVDHSTREVSAQLRIDTGPFAYFGSTKFVGQKSVEESFLEGKLPWKKGEAFNAALIKEMQKRLVETKLFSFARIAPAEKLDEGGLIPITIEVKERKQHTVSVGGSYYTDEGPGAKASWENRNLFHKGERLTLEGKASGIGYEGKGQFQKPSFLRNDQSLIIDLRLAQDDNDAYTSKNTETKLALERELMEKMKLGAGPAFRLTRVENVQGSEDFALFSFPAHFDWDTSDDLLDPVRGGRLKVQVAPFLDTLHSDLYFFKEYVSYSHYFKVFDHPQLTVAGRAAVGVMTGAERDSIPADVRFYAGGGNSIRGYRYLTVGPLLHDKPIGGSSLMEFSTELRAKITEKIGGVVFLDGGNAFEAAYPDFSEGLRWGAGGGLRYFTPVGPLRLDIAFPLNRRKSIDDAFQLYFSIGQAF